MLVPALVLGIIMILGMLTRKIFGSVNRPFFLITVTVILLAMSALRSSTVGSDTASYIARFDSLLGMSFDEVKTAAYAYKDPLFIFLSWAFGKVIPNVQAWLGFATLVFLIGAALVCWWESPDYAFSFIYIYCMGLFFFTMTGMRQSISTGILMISYYFLVKRQFIPFAILVYLASCFHGVAIVFIIAYPFAMVRAGWLRVFIGLLFFILVVLLKDQIGPLMLRIIPDQLLDERIVNYAGRTARLTASGFVIQFAMMLFCLRYRRDVVEEVPHRESLYNLASIALIFQAASISIAEFFRVSSYFSWGYMVLIPVCMQYESENNRSFEFVRYAVIAVLIAYFFYSTIHSSGIEPYTFFWEAGPLE